MSVAPSRAGDRRFFGDYRHNAQMAEWRRLRRREVVHKISDYIMRLRHEGRDVERWLARLARVCHPVRPPAETRPDPKAQKHTPLALLRRQNKALRQAGGRPRDPRGVATLE